MIARTLSVDRKKWKKARHLEWNKSAVKYRGCQWRGTFWTQKVCPFFCADQFRFGEPEFVFTTSKSQKFRVRGPFGVDECRRGSVVRHSAFQSEFSGHHFAIPTESRFLEAIPSQLLHPLFVAVAVPVTFCFEKFDCQVGLAHQAPEGKINECVGPAAAQFKWSFNSRKGKT